MLGTEEDLLGEVLSAVGHGLQASEADLDRLRADKAFQEAVRSFSGTHCTVPA